MPNCGPARLSCGAVPVTPASPRETDRPILAGRRRDGGRRCAASRANSRGSHGGSLCESLLGRRLRVGRPRLRIDEAIHRQRTRCCAPWARVQATPGPLCSPGRSILHRVSARPSSHRRGRPGSPGVEDPTVRESAGALGNRRMPGPARGVLPLERSTELAGGGGHRFPQFRVLGQDCGLEPSGRQRRRIHHFRGRAAQGGGDVASETTQTRRIRGAPDPPYAASFTPESIPTRPTKVSATSSSSARITNQFHSSRP